MLQVFIGSHNIASQVSFACCLHVGRTQKVKRGLQINVQLPSQLAAKNQNTRWEIHPVSQECKCSQLNRLAIMGYSRKTFKQGGLKIYVVVEKNPRNFNEFVTLPLEIWTKPSLTHGNSIILCYKTCYTPEIPRPKIKTPVSHKFS